jgi:hypothetical protein
MIAITTENMHKYAAMLRFQVENALGYSIPDSAIRAEIKNGQPCIAVSTDDPNIAKVFQEEKMK